MRLIAKDDVAGNRQRRAPDQEPAPPESVRGGPIGIVRLRAADGHLTFTMTFKVSLWPAGSELYIANGRLGPQMAVIPQGHYQGCA